MLTADYRECRSCGRDFRVTPRRRTYCSDVCAGPHRGTNTDRRYHTARWRAVRLRVLTRAGWRCEVVPNCPREATVADHVRPVDATMTDAEFYDERNLRGACAPHNLRRGHVAQFQRELAGISEAPRRRRTPYG